MGQVKLPMNGTLKAVIASLVTAAMVGAFITALGVRSLETKMANVEAVQAQQRADHNVVHNQVYELQSELAEVRGRLSMEECRHGK